MLPIISNEHFTARLDFELHGILQPPKHFVSTLIILTNFLAPQTRVARVASCLTGLHKMQREWKFVMIYCGFGLVFGTFLI